VNVLALRAARHFSCRCSFAVCLWWYQPLPTWPWPKQHNTLESGIAATSAAARGTADMAKRLPAFQEKHWRKKGWCARCAEPCLATAGGGTARTPARYHCSAARSCGCCVLAPCASHAAHRRSLSLLFLSLPFFLPLIAVLRRAPASALLRLLSAASLSCFALCRRAWMERRCDTCDEVLSWFMLLLVRFRLRVVPSVALHCSPNSVRLDDLVRLSGCVPGGFTFAVGRRDRASPAHLFSTTTVGGLGRSFYAGQVPTRWAFP